MYKTRYLIIFDEFEDRIEVIDIVYDGRDLPAYLDERSYALDRTSPTEQVSQSKKRLSRGRHAMRPMTANCDALHRREEVS